MVAMTKRMTTISVTMTTTKIAKQRTHAVETKTKQW